jgi:nesprin-1
LLTESKLKNWTMKYGREEKVLQIMNQYRTFVSKNKIFQEFQKAFVEFKDVCDEYKRDGEIGKNFSMKKIFVVCNSPVLNTK